jgi:hypothetical protein
VVQHLLALPPSPQPVHSVVFFLLSIHGFSSCEYLSFVLSGLALVLYASGAISKSVGRKRCSSSFMNSDGSQTIDTGIFDFAWGIRK